MKTFLDKAAKAYYEGIPFLTDQEWDFLASKYSYNSVGYSPTDGIKHVYRMYSLQNCFDVSNPPISLEGTIQTPKLDGAAVSLLYVQGRLELALTRGDGKIGRDITEKMGWLVPTKLRPRKEIPKIFQINGEVVAPKSIENSRNFASGSLNLKDIEEFKARDISFFAYDCTPAPLPLWVDNMQLLTCGMGIPTVYDNNTDRFPTDGVVYRINNNEAFEKAGYTSHHPRGAFALKEIKAGVETTLLDVKWQVGKSGIVSPVAILDPILIDDATVARATLHNIEYINELNLEIGCRVEVIRSGDIIPRVVRRI